MRIEEMRIVLMFGAGSRAIFEGQPGKILWSLYSPKGDLIDQRNVDPKNMRMSATGLLTMCDVAEAVPAERDEASPDDPVKPTQGCQHEQGWDHVADDRERCRDCGLVRVNEKLGRI